MCEIHVNETKTLTLYLIRDVLAFSMGYRHGTGVSNCEERLIDVNFKGKAEQTASRTK